MPDLAIQVDNLSKRFTIGAETYRHNTLRDQVMDGLTSLVRGRRARTRAPEPFWALRDVSFEVKRGEVLGIVGRNGAGKSTLLKILSRITKPSAGRAEMFGRIGSLLEVGTGFDRELTGRENIYLSGAILGMRKAEIRRKFDEIVDFAEVGRFIDTPVKRYSSGMYVRLAFAVAAHLEPEILIVDEVLAVGDAAFQRKCLGKMNDVAHDGRTILFVSHNLNAITRFTHRALWLDQGRLLAAGDSEDIVARYLAAGVDERGEMVFQDECDRLPGNEYIRLHAVRIVQNGRTASALDIRAPFAVEVEYTILRPAAHLRVGVNLTAHDGTVVLSSKDTDEALEIPERRPGRYRSWCTVPGNFLNHGQYFVSVGSDSPMRRTNFLLDRVLAFHVELTGGAGGSIPDDRSGLLRLYLPWNSETLACPA